MGKAVESRFLWCLDEMERFYSGISAPEVHHLHLWKFRQGLSRAIEHIPFLSLLADCCVLLEGTFVLAFWLMSVTTMRSPDMGWFLSFPFLTNSNSDAAHTMCYTNPLKRTEVGSFALQLPGDSVDVDILHDATRREARGR